MPTSRRELLHHIPDECDYVAGQVQQLTLEEFMKDETAKRAIGRSLEIIGEASKLLPDRCRPRSSAIDWRAMAGTRDVLIHRYFGVDYDIGWEVATTKLPVLREMPGDDLAEEPPARK